MLWFYVQIEIRFTYRIFCLLFLRTNCNANLRLILLIRICVCSFIVHLIRQLYINVLPLSIVFDKKFKK